MSWGVGILSLHLNYVAGYRDTDHLLFLFERTYNYYVDNHGRIVWVMSRWRVSAVQYRS